MLDSAGISKTLYCNAYTITLPKPYGTNEGVSDHYSSQLDSCGCSQFAALKVEYDNYAKVSVRSLSTNTANGTSDLIGFNYFLRLTNRAPLTQVLYDALMKCKNDYVVKTKTVCEVNLLYGKINNSPLYNCVTVNDTVYTYPALPQAQLMPNYLQCGYVSTIKRCYTCEDFISLEQSFVQQFNHPVMFSKAADLTEENTLWNNLFAQYINAKTGLQKNWLYYADAFSKNKCGVGQLPKGTSTMQLCLSTNSLTDTVGSNVLVQVSNCALQRIRSVAKAKLLYSDWLDKKMRKVISSM